MVRTKPLISIAMCTYNGEKYVRQQLESILNQSYSNLEIIIVDDCSSDSTFGIIQSYAENDRRIKCFRNGVNLGFNKNFEKAILLASGYYIAISDQDDIWLPEKIETLVNGIGDNWLIFSNSSRIGGVGDNQLLIEPGFSFKNYKCILLANFVTGHTTLFKREFIDHLLPFPDKGYYDWWMGFVALYHNKAVFLDKVLTHYRVHESSVIQRQLSRDEGNRNQVNTINEMLSAFAKYKELDNEDREFIEHLSNAYQNTFGKKGMFSLIRMLAGNYRELFSNYKVRGRLSAINFAFKYAGKVKSYATA